KSIRDHARSGYCHFGSIRTLDWNLISPVATAADTKTLDEILPNQAPDVQHALAAPDPKRDVELYDVKKDPGEKVNVAKKRPDMVKKLKKIARQTWPHAPKVQD
ncbi:MAG: hypothetical protein NTW86_09500, partial [Candidatus Sumerlaeota bacterium]|nr:hypothetical protein [Candidatus Sumerlaeota bacterium]